MNPNIKPGLIDEATLPTVVPSLLEADEDEAVSVVLPYPLGGTPAGTPITPGHSEVTL